MANDMNRQRGVPPPTTRPLDQTVYPYEDFFDEVQKLAIGICARFQNSSELAIFRLILLAMLETNASMLSVLTRAKHAETESDEWSGRSADALLLSRPQVESAMVALLLLSDPEKYALWYQQWGWVSQLRFAHQQIGHAGVVGSGDWVQVALDELENGRAKLGITKDQAEITIKKHFRNEKLTSDEKQRELKQFPLPSDIFNKNLLSGNLQPIGDLLYRYWKNLCDPSHSGAGLLIIKSLLRGDCDPSNPKPTQSQRDAFILHRLQAQSLNISAASICITCTAIWHTIPIFKNDVTLAPLLAKAWIIPESGTDLGRSAWDIWAEKTVTGFNTRIED